MRSNAASVRDRVSVSQAASQPRISSSWLSSRAIIGTLLVCGAFLLGLLIDRAVRPSSTRSRAAAPITQRLGGAAGRRAAAAAAAAAAATAAAAASGIKARFAEEAAAAEVEADADDPAADDAASVTPADDDLSRDTTGGSGQNSVDSGSASMIEGVADESEGDSAVEAPPISARGAAEPDAAHAVSDGPPPPVPAGAPTTVTFADGTAVQVYPHAHYDWWPTVEGGWELDSLRAIKLFLELRRSRAGRVVEIDFGCWIGPTVLFAATYADAVYAMEPDASAFREAFHNVALNPAVAAKTTIQQLCISDKPGAIKMYGKPGDSMSTLFAGTEGAKAQSKKAGYTSWQVECMTFDAFIKWKAIDPREIGIVKMDTEGAEARILPQLGPWLREHKPTILLSMHAFLYLEETSAHAALKDVIYSYKTALVSNGGRPIDRESFSVPGWCRLCTLILTDEELPDGVGSWADALAAALPDKKKKATA